MRYLFHDYCVLFPQADEKTLADMAADIRENGLNEPIILYEGKILDGRNRYLACEQAGVEPDFKEYCGDEPLQYVISRNLHRRHLNESQRALMADKIWKMAKTQGGAPVTQRDVKKQFNVGTTIVRHAARVNEMAIDEIKAQVESGVMSIHRAVDVVKKAQEAAGVQITSNTPLEEIEKVREAQKVILNRDQNENIPVRNSDAVEFNAAVLSGVYDGKRYRRDMQEIQAVIAKLESIPLLFQDAVQMIGTLEQEKIFLALLDMLISAMKKTSKKLQFHAITYDEVLAVISSLLENRFKIPDTPPSKERELLEELKKQYLCDCESAIKDALELKKRIKSGADLTVNEDEPLNPKEDF